MFVQKVSLHAQDLASILSSVTYPDWSIWSLQKNSGTEICHVLPRSLQFAVQNLSVIRCYKIIVAEKGMKW